MKLLITGVCGFVGSTLTRAFLESVEGIQVTGVDNLARSGSELHRAELQRLGITVLHGDIRCQSDVDSLPKADWIIDCAANPSVLAGNDGRTSSRQLIEHNLLGTVNLLERCKTTQAGFIMLSSSRVYSIPPLAALPVSVRAGAFEVDLTRDLPLGLTFEGISEAFSTRPPLSLYGSTKLASEVLALEYGATFGFPIWLNRCGVLAGAGQFGRADQGIFAYWINSHLRRAQLRYVGFDGMGHQVRDCLHPRDLVPLLRKQMNAGIEPTKSHVLNVSGGLGSAISLRQLTAWCDAAFGTHSIQSDRVPRAHDLPWVVLDSAQSQREWGWCPQTSREEIFTEIAAHALAHPDWLRISTA